MKIKKENLFFGIIVLLLIFYTANRIGEIYNGSNADLFTKLNLISDGINGIYSNIYLSLDVKNLLWGLGGVTIAAMVALLYMTRRNNYMVGVEHGSATWGSPSDIAKMVDKDYDNNIILTQTERISLNQRKTMRNNNVLVIGGSGTGKTRFMVKPNLMQLHSSYVITDPKGSLINECGKMFVENGYAIKTFNLVDFNQSMKYNPFSYITNEEDILQFADVLIKNLGDKNEKRDFWVKAEQLLYMAIIGYIFYEMPEEKRTFSEFLRMLTSIEVKEDDEDYISEIDFIFIELELGTEKMIEKFNLDRRDFDYSKPPKPEHFALQQWKKYKQAAGKTAKSILISCGARLSAFDINSVKELTSVDEMELDTIGDKKTVVFIITSDTSTTFNFLAAIFYTQLFITLCKKADTVYRDRGNRLPVHVRCILDEFANIGQIPDFQAKIATIRSREISATIILQNLSQLKALYKDDAETIVGNCDTTLFLGSSEEKTIKMISEKVGKTTVDHRGSSTSKGQQGNYTVSDQIIARDLITPAEVALLPRDECLLFINGIKPFKSKKFDIKKHKRYKQLSDFDKNNSFDIVKYNEELAKAEANIDKVFENLETDDFEIIER